MCLIDYILLVQKEQIVWQPWCFSQLKNRFSIHCHWGSGRKALDDGAQPEASQRMRGVWIKLVPCRHRFLKMLSFPSSVTCPSRDVRAAFCIQSPLSKIGVVRPRKRCWHVDTRQKPLNFCRCRVDTLFLSLPLCHALLIHALCLLMYFLNLSFFLYHFCHSLPLSFFVAFLLFVSP